MINFVMRAPLDISENEFTDVVSDLIMRVLERRTYYKAIVEKRSYVDAYEKCEARCCMRAAFAAQRLGLTKEALAWYRQADVLFCGGDNFTAMTLTDTHVYMQIMETSTPTEWSVVCHGEVVTPYGTANQTISFGTITAEILPEGFDYYSRLVDLNKIWDAIIDEEVSK